MASTMSTSGRRCPIFFGGMSHGQKIFTAQCSHMASATPALSSVNHDDDQEEEEAAAEMGNGVLVLSTHLEYPAIANGAAHDGFAVIVRVKAPAMVGSEAGRAPLDLVTVLDVSTSMAGPKLQEVKRAMGLVIDSLGPRDRLSVVAFSDGARRVVDMTRMSEDGKAAAKRAVDSIAAAGSTNIRAGLDEAAKVLEGSWRENDVAGVILLSDGYDNYNIGRRGDLLPPYLLPTGDWRRTPVHTFGFGSDHDEEALHGVSEATGGTFSFIENHGAIQDALALCVGGLRSVTAQGVWIDVECQDTGVRVRAVKSGRYKSKISNEQEKGHDAWVDVGELYAGEERRFLFFLDVPRLYDAGHSSTRLIKLRCNYLDTATGQPVGVELAGVYVEVLRPLDATGVAAPTMEVQRELLRVEAAEDIALALEAAERGDYAEAARILGARRDSVSRSAPALSGDAACRALAAELHELSLRVAGEWEYKLTGRAFLLASMSAHAQQRGSSVRLPRPSPSGLQFSYAGSAMFATPAIRRMEKSWEMLRQRQAAPAPPPPPENGTKAIARSRLEARLATAAPRLSMLRKYRRLLPFKRL